VDGKLYDLEVHFVHTLADQASGAKKYTVYGVFFDVEEGGGEYNPFLASLFTSTDSHKHGYAQKPKVGVQEFFDSIKGGEEFWTYDGSFTTPPCTEGLNWIVAKKVQPISVAQLKEFTSRLADDKAFANGRGNNRNVQPLNKRKLSVGTIVKEDDS